MNTYRVICVTCSFETESEAKSVAKTMAKNHEYGTERGHEIGRHKVAVIAIKDHSPIATTIYKSEDK